MRFFAQYAILCLREARGNVRNKSEAKGNDMTNAIFKEGETIEIIGMQRDCECFHCGRQLKVGVQLKGFGGAFGAQCVASAAKVQKVGQYKQKLNADRIKDRAIAAHRGENNVFGWKIGSAVFQLELKTALNAK